jgi:hypothetical protein
MINNSRGMPDFFEIKGSKSPCHVAGYSKLQGGRPFLRIIFPNILQAIHKGLGKKARHE